MRFSNGFINRTHKTHVANCEIFRLDVNDADQHLPYA